MIGARAGDGDTDGAGGEARDGARAGKGLRSGMGLGIGMGPGMFFFVNVALPCSFWSPPRYTHLCWWMHSYPYLCHV